MMDLVSSISLMLLISTGFFWFGLRTTTRLSRFQAITAMALSLVAMIAFSFLLLDSLWFATVLPFSNAIVLANWLPPGTSLLAGLVWGRLDGRAWRKAILIVPLMALGLYRGYGPLLGDPPDLNDRWKGAICLQSSSSSCSPAAAATLLRSIGIQSSESEMARLCLTRADGTPMLGLYRGLKIKTAGTGWRVEPFHTDIAGLRDLSNPALLTVRLEPGPDVDPRYAKEWGWAPGMRHTVVFFGFLPLDTVDIGDPNVGRERWSMRDLRVLWHGEGLKLVRDQR